MTRGASSAGAAGQGSVKSVEVLDGAGLSGNRNSGPERAGNGWWRLSVRRAAAACRRRARRWRLRHGRPGSVFLDGGEIGRARSDQDRSAPERAHCGRGHPDEGRPPRPPPPLGAGRHQTVWRRLGPGHRGSENARRLREGAAGWHGMAGGCVRCSGARLADEVRSR